MYGSDAGDAGIGMMDVRARNAWSRGLGGLLGYDIRIDIKWKQTIQERFLPGTDA